MTNVTSPSSESMMETPKTGLRGWNFKPDVPLQISPFFVWPLNPGKALVWVFRSWFPVSERLLLVPLAIVSWFYLHPALERCKEFAPDWILQIYVRNLGLMVLVAGGLHLYFYTFRKQGDNHRFDTRALAKNNRVFTFNNQIFDNMFWTCASGVTVWTAYEVVMMWGMANGYVPYLMWSDNPVWFVVLFALVPLWESFYFYFIHRLIHYPFLYRTVHSLHHRNINVGPWSGMSMHPVEHIIYLGSVLIHWLVISHPIHVIYHLQYFTLTAATTHTGFDGLVKGNKNKLGLGTFHHQMHHRYFECNYGGLELPLDKWFGSFHDGTVESHEKFLERRRRMTGVPQ